MSNSYLSIAQHGKNQWWRYLCGVLLILFWFMVVGTIAALIVYASMGGDLSQKALAELGKSRSLTAFITNNIPCVFGLVGTIVTVQSLHRRSGWTLINAQGQLDLSRFSYGFIVWFVIVIIPTVISLLIQPSSYEFNFSFPGWPLFLLASLVLTTIQTSWEEFFFRGYILQGMSLLSRNRLLLAISNGLLFMLPHLGNPELANGFIWVAPQYLLIGIFLAYITLQDNRMELALGVHAANNISHVFFTTTDSVLGAPALWTTKPSPAGIIDIVVVLVSMAIAYYFFFYKRLWS
jgi:uncharacterized protein